MKYIKKYENYEDEYEEGDYVLINIDEIKKTIKAGESLPDDIYGVIDQFNDREGKLLYGLKLFDYNDHEVYEVTEEEIERRLTPEEINIFDEKRKIYKTSTKYNL